MFSSMLLATTLLLAPAQAGALALTNVRSTFGELGGVRPETKFIPGDVLYVGFDIEGIRIGGDGRAKYRMAMEVLDKAGKLMFKQDPVDKTDIVPLGGAKLPARAYLLIGLDQEPGLYTMKVTVSDSASKVEKSLTKTFEVVKAGFGIVSVYPSIDVAGGIPASTTGIVGTAIFVQCSVVGYQLDKDPTRKDAKLGFQPNVTFEMTPLDDKGEPTMAKPELYTQDAAAQVKLDEKEPKVTVRFLVPMTRAGKFTIRLKATDNNSKKTATFNLPIVVLPSSN